ncbi:hypothetical protein QYE76_022823 [Lolium multiflorum]|uniref:Uncharacterized protein n=1 Tax=Lolium multiflorum TaxID=4521 RepID=A0AAD8RB06_LOLMU|nr:hypothetical protein QYE76_022823 [Lolium multiflorum]
MVNKKSLTAAAALPVVAPPPDPPQIFRRERSNRLLPSPRAAKLGSQAWGPDSVIQKRDEKRSRSLGLISSDEGNVIFPGRRFVEPPSKKAKSGAAPPTLRLPKLRPKAVPAACVSTASSLSKGKKFLLTAAATPPSTRSKKQSSSSKLDDVKIDAAACQEVDSLKEELGKLKEKLKEEEAFVGRRSSGSRKR